MFKEISILLNATDTETSFDELKHRVQEDNLLQKSSTYGRKKSFSLLKKTYGLDPRISLFRAFRWAWSLSEEDERPVLALLCALCRDASLRVSASYILELPPGAIAEKKTLSSLLEEAFQNGYSPVVIRVMTRELLSSWTQSGHLHGSVNKKRTKASPNAVSTVFALYIGHLSGLQGRTLFDSLWVHALDATERELKDSVHLASKKGWIKYRESGGMMEITFSPEIFAGVTTSE
ncbi:hypothetical protein E2N92_03970 [Methanofollis formosanus]|uniref:Uncharacterized protein n=1 Tax=Methanofollis formosanus TaxID=299308 RepID=A0A8G1A1F2_9EURY|nr:hypothetical protein [Methanofollis formosanus]QYZ78639.1 hypothetical protein E2N92_03970 [Methanofollis formosanus]